MSSPIAAQPYPDKVLPFDKTVPQPIWRSILECAFFFTVAAPGALLWGAWQAVTHTRPHRGGEE